MKNLFFCLLLFLSFPSLPQLTPRPIGANNGCCYGYMEYLPDHYQDSVKWPLILYFSGIGERGNGTTDLPLILKNGPIRMVSQGQKIPAIIIAPQSNDGWYYTEFIGGIREDGTTHTILKPKSLIELIKKYKVDTTRIYVTGLSAGGKGAMKALGFFPEVFAAGLVICPADSGNRDYQIKSPVWIFHNEFDNVIPLQRSKNIMYNLKKSGLAYSNLTIYPNLNYHNAWDQTYGNQAVWAWFLLQKKRNPVNVTVELSTLFSQKKYLDFKIDSLLNGAKVLR